MSEGDAGRRVAVLHLESSDLDAGRVASLLAAEAAPYDVQRARGRGDFLDALATREFDLVLSDLALPEWDGLAAMAEVRRRFADLPFVFVSGAVGEARVIESLREGATDYVLKDQLERLVTVVRRALREADDRVERRASTARTERLQSLAAALAATPGREDVARVAIEHGIAALGAAIGGCWLLDGDALLMLAQVGYRQESVANFGRVPLDAAIPIAEAARRDAPVWIESRARYRAEFPQAEAMSEERSADMAAACLPLSLEGRVLGTLAFRFDHRHRFGEADRAVLSAIARQCSQALDRARLYDSERAAREELARLLGEARRAEERAKEEELRVRLALEAGGMGAWEWNVASGRVRWSERVEVIYGFKPGSFGGTMEDYEAALHPDDRADVHAAIRQAIAGRTDLRMEHRVVRPGGEVRWVEGRGAPVFGADGALERMLGVCVDVTDRKAAELRLRESEGSLRFLSEASAALGDSLDEEATLTDVTALAVPTLADCAFVDLAGPDGSLRRIAVAHVDPRKADVVWELGRRFPPRPEEPSVIGRAFRDGAPTWLAEVNDAVLDRSVTDPAQRALIGTLGLRSFLCAPLATRSRVVGVLTLATTEPGREFREADVALAQELARRIGVTLDNAQLYREAREASRLKDEFIATVSHELRTPMTAILGWTAMLPARSGDPAALRRGLEVIERNARAQARLIDDVLDVSRIVTGKLHLAVATVDLAAVVRTALDTVGPRAQTKGVGLVVEVPADLGTLVGDPDRLQQVVWNLTWNAVKFTPRGGTVTVRGERSGDAVTLVVADTGEGIAPEFLPHVFERFRQADSSSTRSHGGLGLGLAITRHLVGLHGGTVRAESGGAGQGATFTVTLPLAFAELTRATAPEEETTEGGSKRGLGALKGVRVLVVDDEPDAREILAEVLRGDGAEVELAGSVAAALARFDEWRPDVLVSDIGMPGEDGHALIRRVRARSPEEGGHTPAVAVTAYAQAEDARRALAAGFQRHMTKPVEPEALVALVASLRGRTVA